MIKNLFKKANKIATLILLIIITSFSLMFLSNGSNVNSFIKNESSIQNKIEFKKENSLNVRHLSKPTLETKKEKTINKRVATEPVDKNSFFPIYKQSAPTKTLTTIESLGSVRAVKLGGFKLHNYNLLINEISLKDTSSNNINYTIKYLRAQNLAHEASKPSYNTGELSYLNDNDLSSLLKVTDIFGPQGFEVNLLLNTPTPISDIQIAFNASLSSFLAPWEKMGTIELFMDNGEVYRCDGMSLTEHKIGSANDGSVFNFSIAHHSVDWNYYKKSSSSNDIDSFMWSYDPSKATPGTDVYFGDSAEDKSITPIIASSTSALLYDSSTNIQSNSFYLSQVISVEQELNFLKEIDDTGFRQSILSILNLDSEKFENLTSDILMNYDNALKWDSTLPPNNHAYWKMEILLKGDGNSLDATTFKNMSFFGNFKNMYSLNISATTPTNNGFQYILNMDDMTWLSTIDSLTELTLAGPKGPNTLFINGSLRIYGTPNLWNFFQKSLNIRKIDISSYEQRKYANDNLVQKIANSNWISFIPRGLIVYVPSKIKIGTLSSTKINEIFTTKEIKDTSFDYVELTKISDKPISDPQISFDSNTKAYSISSIFVNGQEVHGKILGGKLYWDLTRVIGVDISDIVKMSSDRIHYFTQNDPHNGFLESELTRLSPRPNYTNVPVTNISIRNLGQLTTMNKDSLTKQIIINEQKYSSKLYNGNLFWDVDISKINFAYQDPNNADIHYFTSLTKVIEAIGENNLEKMEIFELENNSNPNDFNGYHNLDPASLNVRDPELWKDNQEIYVDGDKYTKWILKRGISLWDLEGKAKIEDIKYKDSNGHYYTKIFDDSNNILPNLTTIISHHAYSIIPKPDSPLTDPGILQNPNDLAKTITINKQKIGVTLVNGILYWNFDISTVKFVVYLLNADGSIKGYQYYTLFSNIPKTVNANNISSIEESAHRDVPSKFLFGQPQSQKITSYIKIDGNFYHSVFAYGKWYWNIPKDILSKIRYKDSNNEYFFSINSSNYTHQGLTEVIVPSSLVTSIDLANAQTSFPIQLTKAMMDIVNGGYIYNNETHWFLVLDDQIYFQIEDYERAKFIAINTDGSFGLYSSLEGVSDSQKSHMFSREFIKYNTPIEEAKVIPAPKSVSETPRIVLKNGRVINVYVIKTPSGLLYDNIEALSKVKYINENGIYFESIRPDYVGTGYWSIDIKKSILEKIAGSNQKVNEVIINASNTIAKVALFSSFASAGVGIIIILMVKFFKKNKWGGPRV